jgi:hypothetical protein
LTDLQGKVQRVWKKVIAREALAVDGLAPGIYLVRIIDANFTKNMKIIIE